MAGRSFLGDMLTTLFERQVPRIGAKDERTLEEMCRALLDAEGEVSGVRLAQAILDRYTGLGEDEKLAFFAFLNDDLEIDVDALTQSVLDWSEAREIGAYRRIAAAAEPRRQELLRRLNQPPGATRALVAMRSDLLVALDLHPELKRTDLDFSHLLRSWFNRGFLVLRQISWETPASILEKIVEYEAVHAIGSWDELRRRIYPKDRRCFAYFHPTMPEEPLIFVEIALTKNVPNSIQKVLTEDRVSREPEEVRVAVFYSISNCQEGLRGISFGNLLIKQVVDELRTELPELETFVTLSPIPRLNDWLATQDDERAGKVLSGDADEAEVATAATEYLMDAKNKRGEPWDPVARFHLGNGAQIFAVHAGADLSENGLKQSSGAMVSYHYDLDRIEQNHERFKQEGVVSTAPGFRPGPASGQSRKQRRRA